MSRCLCDVVLQAEEHGIDPVQAVALQSSLFSSGDLTPHSRLSCSSLQTDVVQVVVMFARVSGVSNEGYE